MSESVCIYYRMYPTDDTYILVDSLHSRFKEFLIEGDGWKLLSKLQNEEKIVPPCLIWDDNPIYETVHQIYLDGLDAVELD